MVYDNGLKRDTFIIFKPLSIENPDHCQGIVRGIVDSVFQTTIESVFGASGERFHMLLRGCFQDAFRDAPKTFSADPWVMAHVFAVVRKTLCAFMCMDTNMCHSGRQC